MDRHDINPGKHRGDFLMVGMICLTLLAAAGKSGAQAQAAPMPLTEQQIAETAAEAETAFARLDTNHDRQLSLDEFKAAPAGRRQGLVYPRLPAHFRTRDLDQSGFLEAEEFAALQMVINAGSAAPTLASADGNGDGRLDFREYVLLMAMLDGALPQAGTDKARQQ
ncbi:MAG: hypothetical protein KAY03_04195 [Arenimonas sp.]|nr:hypothetical protein [Arenimonas sp.]